MANIRIDFPQLGEGQYVEIKDPKFLEWGVQKRITSALADVNMEAQLDVAEMIAIALIKAGYVVNEDGVPFTFPLTEETVKAVPASIVETVTAKFIALRSQPADRKN